MLGSGDYQDSVACFQSGAHELAEGIEQESVIGIEMNFVGSVAVSVPLQRFQSGT